MPTSRIKDNLDFSEDSDQRGKPLPPPDLATYYDSLLHRLNQIVSPLDTGPALGAGRSAQRSALSYMRFNDFTKLRAVNTSLTLGEGTIEGENEINYVSRRMYASSLGQPLEVSKEDIEASQEMINGRSAALPQIVLNDAVPPGVVVAVDPATGVVPVVFDINLVTLANGNVTITSNLTSQGLWTEIEISAWANSTVPEVEVETIECEPVAPDAKLDLSQIIRVATPFDIFLDESEMIRDNALAPTDTRLFW